MDLPFPVLPAFALVAGLLLGSFLNVCIARLPQHRSVIWPGSHCPLCQAPIRPFDNIPLLSFLLLRGRCRHCRGRIAARYPLVEAGLASLFVLAAFHFPATPTFAAAAVFCFFLLGLLVMDWETMLLPNAFTLPGLALGLSQAALPGGGLIGTLGLANAAPLAVPGWSAWVGSFLGAAGAASMLLLLRFLYFAVRRREGMGLGDGKLAAMLGAWLGVAGVALTLVLAVLLCALAGLLMLTRRRVSSGPLQLPFGSYLCAAGLLVLYYGQQLLRWYFSFWSLNP